MRSWVKWTSRMGAVACMALVGCDDTGDSGAQDMAVAGDMAAATVDMAQPPGDMAVGGDMTPPTTFSGTMLLQELAGALPTPNGPLDSKVLAATIGFGSSAGPKPDLDKRITGTPLGCYANWYDIDAADAPQLDQNDQPVNITGYTGGMFADQSTAPSEINCVPVNGFYSCGYGPIANMMPGPSVTTTPFPAAGEPMKSGDMIKFKAAMAGTNIGTFDVSATVGGTLAVTESLTSGSLFSPTADTTINFTCPDGVNGACGGTAVLVTVTVSPEIVGATFPGKKYGQVVCAGLAQTGTITIPKDIIAVAFGATPANIATVYTRVVRGTLPGTNMDSKGNSLTVAVGRGAFGFADRRP